MTSKAFVSAIRPTLLCASPKTTIVLEKSSGSPLVSHLASSTIQKAKNVWHKKCKPYCGIIPHHTTPHTDIKHRDMAARGIVSEKKKKKQQPPLPQTAPGPTDSPPANSPRWLPRENMSEWWYDDYSTGHSKQRPGCWDRERVRRDTRGN